MSYFDHVIWQHIWCPYFATGFFKNALISAFLYIRICEHIWCRNFATGFSFRYSFLVYCIMEVLYGSLSFVRLFYKELKFYRIICLDDRVLYYKIISFCSLGLLTPNFSNRLMIVSCIHFFFETIFPNLFIIKFSFIKPPDVL